MNGGFLAPFGGVSQQMVADWLAKSLSAGEPVPNTATDGGQLQMESVDGSIASATYEEADFVLFQWLTGNGLKITPKSIIHQWVKRTQFGSLLSGAAFGERGVAPNVSPNLVRLFATLRPLQAQGDYTLPADQLGGNAIGGGYKQEAYRDTSMDLLGKLTWLAYHGDSAFNADEPDGFFKQIEDNGTANLQVWDLAGNPLTPDFIKYAATVSGSRTYSQFDTMFCSPGVAEGIDRLIQPMVRAFSGKPVQIGQLIEGIRYMGTRLIVPKADSFLDPARMPIPTAATGSTAPATPVTDGGTAGNTGSSFTAAQAGTYQYRFAAIGTNGHISAASAADSVAVAEGEDVTFELDDNALSGVLGYHVWRTKADGSVFYYLGRFANNADGTGGDTEWIDTNAVIAGTVKCWATRAHKDYAAWAQLKEMQSILQPIAGMVQPYIFFQVACPFIRVTEKALLFINVGEPDTDIAISA